jgi:hypothetical protein
MPRILRQPNKLFHGTTSAAIFDAIIHSDPPSAERVNPMLSAELNRVIVAMTVPPSLGELQQITPSRSRSFRINLGGLPASRDHLRHIVTIS